MRGDPFTLRVALDKGAKAKGELYLDEGDGYMHEKGEVVWREFEASPVGDAKKNAGKSLRLRSKDLVRANLDKTVDNVDLSLALYTPQNAFAQSMQRVKIERIVVLGLDTKPSSVKTSDGRSLEWEFEEGVGAADKKGKGKKEGNASVLVVKNPGVSVVDDWDIVIE